MKDLEAKVKQLSASYFEEIKEIRRHIHKNPELSFKETETSRFISEKLQAWNIEHQCNIGGYGIKALIRGKGASSSWGDPSRVIALRADIDALPIQENTGLDFASQKPGIMHACGHDAHTSIVLSCARILKNCEEDFQGTFVLIFQGAEEKNPGGAQAMIADGVLENPRPDLIIGEHVNPGLDAGCVGFRPGLMMASVDDLYIRVQGLGGHGASPHSCVDPIVVSAQIISALQQLVSRNANPDTPTVLTFGKIQGLGSTNIIPEYVDIEGTFRTVDDEWREEALKRIPLMIEGIAQALGAKAQVKIDQGYPALNNDAPLSDRLKKYSEDFLGSERVKDLPLVMWAEDFAYYGKKIPACFYNIGVRNLEQNWASPLHSPNMMVDERILEFGPGLMAHLGLSELAASKN